MKDVDLTKTVTARLEYADMNSSNWTECTKIGDSTVSVTYSDTEKEWDSFDLKLDVLNYDYGDANGMLKQIRIAVDYTMPDGTTGTIYSTDCAKLFVYTGGYITSVSSSYTDNTVTGKFKIDTSLVQDLDALTLTQLSLVSISSDDSNVKDIMESASITPFDSDGTFTVTYKLSDGTLSSDNENSLLIAYEYSDYDYAIASWESFASASLVVPETFTAPTLDSASIVRSSSNSLSYVPFTVTVNDGTKYGDLKAILKQYTGGAYATFTGGDNAVSALTLNKGDDSTEWKANSSTAGQLIADLKADNGFAFVRVDIQYTDDAGDTKTVSSDPMVVYKGNYVTPITEGTEYVGNLYFYAYFQVNPDLVNLSKVKTVSVEAVDGSGNNILDKAETFELDKTTGKVTIYGHLSNLDWLYEVSTFNVSVTLLYEDESAGPVKVEWSGSSSQNVGATGPIIES